jgi:predicted ATPase/DNA-binding CsgD family transcriptional regulator/DNA-binding XRE family transcriptional regulator
MTEDPVPFGQRLRSLREAAGMTQEVLAEKAGLSVQGIAALERGRSRRPYPHTVRALGDALDLSAEDQALLLAAIPDRGRDRRDDADDLDDAPVPGLPVLEASLFGREGAIAEMIALLDAGSRMVTLTGPGGVGKTSLAIALAHALSDEDGCSRYPGGITFVPLAAIDEPDRVLPTIVHALRIPNASAGTALSTLQRHLDGARVLLVLDNLEQVIDAAMALSSLLRACPGVSIIATSRAPLRIRSEREYPVPPLDIPALDHVPRVEDVATTPAVEMFVDRAQAALPSFALEQENAATIAAICRRLDGLPLAIELAAARVRVMSPLDILARLDASLPLLADGPRDLPERQRTMTHAIDWSYSLLPEPQRVLFSRLSVFRGGWTLDAAESVSALPGDAPSDDILTWLGALVEQSLVVLACGADGRGRYRMLVPIRQFAAVHLVRSGEEGAVRDAHASYYLALAQQAAPGLEGPRQVEWLARLEQEHDNIRAAIAWLLDQRRAEELVRLTWHLWIFLWIRGYHAEGRSLMDELLGWDDLPVGLRPLVLTGAGTMAFGQGDIRYAEQQCTEGHALFAAAGDDLHAARAALTLGLAASSQGDLDAAARWLEEASEVSREHNLGFWGGLAISALGMLPFRRGDYASAATLLAEGHDMARAAGDRFSRYIALYNLSRLAQARGDLGEAAKLFHEGLRFSLEVGDRANTAYCLEGLASVAVAHHDPHLAARLLGKAESLFAATGSRVYTYRPDTTLQQQTLEAVRQQLNPSALGFEWREGAETPLEHLIDLALPLAEPGRSAAEPVVPAAASQPDTTLRERYALTRREIEILRMLLDHYSNTEISDALYISPRTVSTHLTSINNKMGVSTRHEAARIAAELGLA